MHTYQDEKQEITERMHRHLINPQLLCKEPEYSLLEDLRRLLELALKEDDKKKEYCDLFYAVFSFFLQSTESCTAYFDKDNNLLLEQYKTGSTITCFEDYEGGSLKTRYIYDDGAAETGRKYIFMKKKISSTENIAIPAQKLLHDLIFQKNTKYTQTIYNRPIDKVKIDQLKKKSKDNNSPYLITRDKRYLYIDKWAGDSYNMVLDDAWPHFINLLSQADTLQLTDDTLMLPRICHLLKAIQFGYPAISYDTYKKQYNHCLCGDSTDGWKNILKDSHRMRYYESIEPQLIHLCYFDPKTGWSASLQKLQALIYQLCKCAYFKFDIYPKDDTINANALIPAVKDYFKIDFGTKSRKQLLTPSRLKWINIKIISEIHISS